MIDIKKYIVKKPKKEKIVVVMINNYCCMIVNDAMLTNIYTMMKTKMTRSFALWTFTKAHFLKIILLWVWLNGNTNLEISPMYT